MADTKLTALAENIAPLETDIMYLVDDPSGVPVSEKLTLANLKALINDIATDVLWDAAGDLVHGTGADTGGKLAIGTANYILAVNAGATAPEWVQRDIGARAYNDANISINNSTATVLTFNQERYDTDTIHSVIANTGRLTCNTAGKYIINGVVQFAANNTGQRALYLRINGATVIAITNQDAVSDGASSTRMSITSIYDLSVDDYVDLRAFQNSGGALNVETSANFSPEFMMQRIG